MENKFNNYSEEFLNKRATALFITIPQTDISYTALHNAITAYKQVNYCLTKSEEHKDEGKHIHVLIKFKQQVKYKSIHKIIMEQEGQINGSINAQKPDHIGKVISYLCKIETATAPPLEYGERPVAQGRPKLEDEKDIEYSKAIQLAEEGNVDEALSHIKSIDPKEYLKYATTFKEQLKTENKQRKYYDLPDYSNATLSPSQKKVWNLLQTAPIPRRIIWVSGQYGSGKSFLYQYIKSNHEYEMYDAGQSASLDNVAYGYDQEGVVAWDLPRTFDYEEKGNHIANVIEKFSDFGQSITSKKYKGKTQQVRGHTIVFSNEPPINQLLHRDIIHIELTKTLPIKKEKEISEASSINATSKSMIKNIEPHEKEDLQAKSNSILEDEESSDEDIMLGNDEDIDEEIPNEYIEVITYKGITKYKVLYKNALGQSKTKITSTLEKAKSIFSENQKHK